MPHCSGRWCALITTLALLVTPALAVVQPQDSPVRAKEFRHDALHIIDSYAKANQISTESSQAVRNLASLGVSPAASYLDVRSGRWGTLMPATPLLPGGGVGNNLSWENFALPRPATVTAYEQVVWETFLGYLQSHRDALLIDIGELTNPGNVAIHGNGATIQINAPRMIDGVPVRNSFLTAIIKQGNLILFGSRNWADVQVSAQPSLNALEAQAVVRGHIQPLLDNGFRKSSLEFIPMNNDSGDVGSGVDFRLAWVVRPIFDNEIGRWEALVDAHSGELLAFEDKAHYASARVVEGSVYPRSNDGIGPEGIEQPDFPMPFADIENAGNDLFTDAGGNLLACVDGDITTNLSGRFVQMSDNCGPIAETTSLDILDLGIDLGNTDCSVPANAPSGSAGNTHASRSGFYELNRIKEMGRGHLPGNTWLQGQLNANMNINANCNATWDGTNVNFFTSGGGCGNTGELAGVFDHEWGHGMDNNDLNPTISSPGEGIADIYAYGRLVDSCIGPGFRGSNCGGYGDPCLDCTGVRDIDWAQRASGAPHDVAWANANCPGGGGTPCGGATHCEGAVYAEAFFDLINRDLPGVYGMDLNTALEVANRLNFIGAGPVGSWFQCIIGFGGCNADGGYLNYLAADDDNGNLADGTPHMQAIFDAFNRHGIACGAPTVTDAGCDGGPTTAPVVTAMPLDRGVKLSWDPVAGADHYKIYRTDGVSGCDYGKTPVGQTDGTMFTDSGLKNGHDYSYIVIAFGGGAMVQGGGIDVDTCFSPASSCVAVNTSGGPNLSIAENVSEFELLAGSEGDADMFLDNCEQGKFTVPIFNVGNASLTTVKIVDVVPVSHPGMTVLTPLPLNVDNNLTPCEDRSVMIKFQAEGLSEGDEVTFRVDVMSDQLGVQSQIVTVTAFTELDFDFFASKTFDFEIDPEDWEVVEGTFNRSMTNGGGDGSSWSYDSSTLLDAQCDRIRSPLLSLSANSTLEMWNNWDIEPESGQTWYDRANVGIIDEGGARTLITPDSGRLYNADSSGPGSYTGCNEPEEGWADAMATWGTSGWSAAALGSAGFAGEKVRFEVIYSTDAALANRGFSFDTVTVTNVNVQAPDGQSDSCQFLGPIFLDGFESGDTSQWSSTTP